MIGFGHKKAQKAQKPFVLFFAFLSLFSAFPTQAASQTTDDRVGLRIISVRTEVEAANILREIQSGQSFEALAKAHSTDPSAKEGGFLGVFRLGDLKADLQRAVMQLSPGQISPVTPMGSEFLILQRLTPEEVNWIASYNAGLDAFQNARYEEAARDFLAALPSAEKLKPADYRLEDNLHGLAEAYRLQKKFAEAEPLYRRYLALHWGGSAVPEVLDDFCSLLAVSYFRDSQFEEARKKFEQALQRSPLQEELYKALSTILFKAQAMNDAEALMERAAKLFPMSKDLRYHLGELYANNEKPRKALEIFESVSPVERLQQSVVYLKIAGLHVDLTELDEAAAVYKKVLELIPDSIGARLGLADVYLQQGRPDESLNESNKVLAVDRKNAAAQFRVADAKLRIGRFAEAAEAAARVLDLDPGYGKAHYILATALARIDKKEESDKEFEIYRKIEEDTRAERDRNRNIGVMNRDAAERLVEGRNAEAIEMFQKAIQAFPDSATAYLNLAFAQSRIGQHKASADSLQKMLSQNISDSFLVSWSLAREYRSLGDSETSLRHEVVYLQNVDLALREAVDATLE